MDFNKKGVSVMIGYILLVVFAIIISVIVYQWLRTYVPSEPLQCSEEVSLFIREATFNSSESLLNVIIKNNGKFNVAGYFIHGKNSSGQELATIDLSVYLNESASPARIFGNSVLFFEGGANSFKPGEQATDSFNIPASIGNVTYIRVVPTIFQKEENRNRFVSCGDSRTEGIVGEPFVCVPQTCSSLGYTQCNPPGWSRSDGCGGILDCGTCDSGFNCDASGECYDTSCTPVSNPCGTRVCGTATNGTCGQASCGTCQTAGSECNEQTGQCVSLCGNGIINSGEQCDDGNAASGDGCSSSCQVETGWSCTGQPSVCSINVISCPSYCVSVGYSTGFCTNSAGNCVSNGGTYESGGDQWCTGGAQADTCCCQQQ